MVHSWHRFARSAIAQIAIPEAQSTIVLPRAGQTESTHTLAPRQLLPTSPRSHHPKKLKSLVTRLRQGQRRRLLSHVLEPPLRRQRRAVHGHHGRHRAARDARNRVQGHTRRDAVGRRRGRGAQRHRPCGAVGQHVLVRAAGGPGPARVRTRRSGRRGLGPKQNSTHECVHIRLLRLRPCRFTNYVDMQWWALADPARPATNSLWWAAGSWRQYSYKLGVLAGSVFDNSTLINGIIGSAVSPWPRGKTVAKTGVCAGC